MSDADDNRPAPRPVTRASALAAAQAANANAAPLARPSSRLATRASPRVPAQPANANVAPLVRPSSRLATRASSRPALRPAANANRPVAASAANAKAAASGVAQEGAANDNRRAILSELIVEEPPVVAGVMETRFVGAPEPIVEEVVSEPIANTAATFVLEPNAEKSTAAPTPTTTTDTAEDDENKPVKEEESTATFVPVIQLEEVEVKSGTEEEETLHTFRAKLFLYDETLLDKGTGKKTWMERGIGDASILRHRDHQRLRFLMRQEKTMKVIANHALDPRIVLEPNAGSDRSWVWSCFDFADGELVEKMFAARFANSELADDFKKKYEECQKEMARLLAEEEDAPPKSEGGEGGGASVSFPTLLPPIQLEPPTGPRGVVDYDKAVEFVKVWKELLLQHCAKAQVALAATDQPLILCDGIRLSGYGYTPEAARVIASFIQEPLFDDGSPYSLAQGIIVADLSDVMASLLTAEGLEMLRILCDAFADSKLVEVNLSENAIGEQALGSCETVLTKKSLERLFLCNAGLANKTMARVADILTRDEDGLGCVARNLTTLHFAQNMSGVEGCTEFARIFERCTRIQDLRFAGTRPLSDGSDLVASVLNSSLGNGRNLNLKKLDLNDCAFKTNASHQALFSVLVFAKSLTYLDLGGCGLEDAGVKEVCLALTHGCSILEHLDLSGNDVKRYGAEHIASYICKKGRNLKTLRLEDNKLSCEGAVAIASAFHGREDVPNIEEIQLNICMIGAIGARALIEAFGPNGKNTPNLKHIFLNGNFFADDVLSEVEVAFGQRLGKMDENVSDGDADDELSDLAEEMESLIV